MGILFVVLVHIRFFASAPLGYVPNWALTFAAAAAPFYLPALFFVSGYFVPTSLRRGRLRFVWIKVLTLAWPLLLWNVINTWRGMDLTSISDFLRVSYLWFLLYLFIYSALAALLKGVPAWIPFAISMVLPVLVSGPSVMDLDRVFDFAPYFFAGMVASRWRDSIMRWSKTPLAVVAVIAGLAGCVWSAFPGSIVAPMIQIISLAAIAAGVVLSAWVTLATPTLCKVFRWLGMHSLEIYVLHWQIGLLIASWWPPFSDARLAFFVVGSTVMALACVASWLFKKPGLRLAFSLRSLTRI